MKKFRQKLGRHMTQTRIEQISIVFVGIMVIGSVSFFGSFQKHDTLAASAAKMYVAPDSGSYRTGSTLSVHIREDSGTAEVNSVQAALQYDPRQLQYIGAEASEAFPFEAATSTSTPGQVRIARGVQVGSAGVNGDNPVASVNFRVVAAEGTANVSFDTGYSLIVRSGDSSNLLISSLGASYSIKN